MSTHQREEWNVVEKSAYSCSHPTWKPSSRVMAIKKSHTPSWVPVRSLPWAQCKNWTLITLMGCVHTHQGILRIEGCGIPSHVWSIVEKDGEDN